MQLQVRPHRQAQHESEDQRREPEAQQEPPAHYRIAGLWLMRRARRRVGIRACAGREHEQRQKKEPRRQRPVQ